MVEAKRCPKCDRDLLVSEFQKNRSQKDGLQSWCKNCSNENKQRYRDANREHVNANARKYESDPARRAKKRAWSVEHMKKNSDRYVDLRLKRLYGISLEEYRRRFEAQGGVCDMCGQPEYTTFRGKVRRLSVDHCHKTGKVRGLLCSDCNIGAHPDDIEMLQLRIDYLRRHSQENLEPQTAESPSDYALYLRN